MGICKVKLKGRREIAAGTMAFHFDKPEGFSYKAGQFGDFALTNPAEPTRKETRAGSPWPAPPNFVSV